MPLTQDERALHAFAIKRIQAGELPDQAPKAIWGGNGGGDPCALCGKPITPKDVEYEMQDPVDRVFLFHIRCHALWQLALPGSGWRAASRDLEQ